MSLQSLQSGDINTTDNFFVNNLTVLGVLNATNVNNLPNNALILTAVNFSLTTNTTNYLATAFTQIYNNSSLVFSSAANQSQVTGFSPTHFYKITVILVLTNAVAGNQSIISVVVPATFNSTAFYAAAGYSALPITAAGITKTAEFSTFYYSPASSTGQAVNLSNTSAASGTNAIAITVDGNFATSVGPTDSCVVIIQQLY